jgi:hypothetical protein
MKSLAATGLLAVSMLAIPATSQADVRVGIHIDARGGYHRDGQRIGYNLGYEDGYREGTKDGRRGDRYGFWDEGRYRDGDHGYRGSYGPRWEYRNAYRNGFEAGYRRAYAGFRRGYDDRRYDRGDDRYRRR